MDSLIDTMNVSVVAGVCSAEPEIRELAPGTVVANLSLRTTGRDGATTSVPVTVWDPPSWLETVAPGELLAVLGAVRRRFYRPAAGGTGSRVDVEAELVVRAGDRRRVGAFRRRVASALEAV